MTETMTNGTLLPGERVLPEREGLLELHRLREEPWKASLGGEDRPLLRVLVSERPYTARVEPAWLPVFRLAPGTASAYPVKALCTNGAPGQWKFNEVLGVALTEDGEEWRNLRDQGAPCD